MPYLLTVIGDPATRDLDQRLTDRARRALQSGGAEPGSPDWLSPGEAVDIAFDAADLKQVQTLVATELAGAAVDFGLQPAADRRKGLLVADMESTIIGQEMIDELADLAGVGPQITAITARTMAGELNFEEALIERVALLKDLPAGSLAAVSGKMTLNPGARALVATMRAHGALCALVSGGFSYFADRIGERCGFDEARSNRLIVEGERLSGAVETPILGREAKQESLEELARARGLSLHQPAAVGDGANDLAMIAAAGLGVAYRGKPILRAAARFNVDHGDLTALLFLQGYRREEFVS